MLDALLEGIYNYRRLSDTLATAGQPTEDELVAVAEAGFQIVVNLALHDTEYSLPGEREIVNSLGMRYIHIPVVWERPTRTDLEQFFETMDKLSGHRLFIHCAANKRVSVFVSLYRRLRLGWPPEDVIPDVEAIWEPDAVWRSYMDDMVRQLPLYHSLT
ncbi:MAG TPA: protein tyrosine phosphatase family protein [Sulfuricaulis sp.]